jgi:hypothetical protein
MARRDLWIGSRFASVGPGPVRRIVVVVAVAALVVLLASGPAFAQFAPVPGREYKEFFNPVNPVRGEAVVGFAALPTAEAIKGTAIEVWLPGNFDGDLQVETLTADGRFRGEGVYRGKSPGGRWVPLTLTGSSPSRPGDPATLALAVRGPGSAVFVARWATTPARPAARLRLYVNGRRADMFVRVGTKTAQPCVALTIAQPLRFDAYCDVDRRDVPPDGVITLIRRDQFDEQEQHLRVNIGGLP